MYIESASKPKKDISRYQKFAYVFASTLIIIMKIIVLSLHEWFKYCWWDFALIYASTFMKFKNFQNESSISDVQNDSCGSIKSLVIDYCPGFCNQVVGFEKAGVTMMFFGIISILLEILCLAFHLWNFFKHSFRFKKIWAVIVMPKFLFALGFAVWYGVTGPYSQKSVISSEAKDFSLEGGFYLAVCIVCYDFLLMLFGLLRTRKAFVKK